MSVSCATMSTVSVTRLIQSVIANIRNKSTNGKKSRVQEVKSCVIQRIMLTAENVAKAKGNAADIETWLAAVLCNNDIVVLLFLFSQFLLLYLSIDWSILCIPTACVWICMAFMVGPGKGRRKLCITKYKFYPMCHCWHRSTSEQCDVWLLVVCEESFSGWWQSHAHGTKCNIITYTCVKELTWSVMDLVGVTWTCLSHMCLYSASFRNNLINLLTFLICH